MPRSLDLFSLLLVALGGLTATGGAFGVLYGLARLAGLVGSPTTSGTEVGSYLLAGLLVGTVGGIQVVVSN